MTVDGPATSSGRRASRPTGHGYSPVSGGGLVRVLARSTLVTAWLLLWLVGTAAAATAVVDVDRVVDIPDRVALWGGGLVGWLHVVALAHRVGGRARWWGLWGRPRSSPPSGPTAAGRSPVCRL